MANIPKLNRSIKVNEGVRVANVQGAGEAEAKAISAMTKAIQTGIAGTKEIHEMKVREEDRELANQSINEIQAKLLDDQDWQQEYKQNNNGKITGYTAWKASKIQDMADKMGNKFTSNSVKSSFLNSAAGINRKSMVFSFQDENRQVMRKVKDRFDSSLASGIAEVNMLPSNVNGERAFNVLLQTKFKEIDDAVKDGTIKELDAKEMKDTATDRLGINRLKSLTEGGSFRQAVTELNKYKFSNPAMQERAERIIDAGEVKRIRDLERLERVQQRQQVKQQQELDNEYFSKVLELTNDKNIDVATLEEKYEDLNSLYKKAGVSPKNIGRLDSEVSGRFQAYTDRVKSSFMNPDLNSEDKGRMIQSLIDLSAELPVLSENRGEINSLVSTLKKSLDSSSKKFIKQKLDEIKLKFGEFQGPEVVKSISKYDDLPLEGQYEAAIAEAEIDKEALKFSEVPKDMDSRVANIEDMTPLIVNDQAKQELINTIASDWFTNKEEATQIVESRIEDAKKYIEALSKKEETMSNIRKKYGVDNSNYQGAMIATD